MRLHPSKVAGLALIVLLIAAASPATAGASFDFLFSMNSVTNDNQLFLNLAVSRSGYDRSSLEPVLPRIRYVEADLPVVLFLAEQSRQPLDLIVDLRAQGLTWSAILVRLNLPVDVLFAGIDADPGPPYGKAWGYWRKNPRAVRFSDEDVRGLVQVQIGSRCAAASPLQLARARGQGRSVIALVADKKGRPYRSQGAGHEEGRGRGKGRGRSKG